MVKRLLQLDGLRGIAALMVIFYHFFIDLELKTNIINLIKKVSTIGQTGVTLFFVLSGFLITRILLNEKTSKSFFKSFYWRRIIRIFPLYYFFLLIFYFLLPFFSKIPLNSEHANISYYFIFLQNLAITFNWNSYGPVHYWSLAVEEHFYILFPLIVYYSNIKNLKLICYFLIVFSILTRILLVFNHYEVYFFSFSAFDAIVFGALVSIFEYENKLKLYFNSLIKFFIYFFLPAVILWIIFSGKRVEFMQIIKLSITSILYTYLIGYLVNSRSENKFNSILSNKFLLFTGKISFGLYVYHPLVLLLINQYLNPINIISNFILFLFITYFISWISWELFESRLLVYKKYFDYK